MLRLMALGSLGYFALRYIRRTDQSQRPRRAIRLAGGQLSSQARLQQTPDAPPL